MLLACLYLLYTVVTGDAGDSGASEVLLRHAESSKAIAEAYASATESETYSELGKTGGILVFVFKMYAKFADGRTALKKKELDGY